MIESRPDPPPACPDSPGLIHLVAGLPTPAVASAFERMRTTMAVQTFSEFVGSTFLGRIEMTMIVPPHIETSLLIENWEECDYLSARLGQGARIANIITVIDSDFLIDQLASAEAISAYGWGKNGRDGRSVADIVVGQIESATHLLLVGRSRATDPLHRLLDALNPTALRHTPEDLSPVSLSDFMTAPFPTTDGSTSQKSARVVPPWLKLLQSDEEDSRSEEQFLYRRSLPFDRERFSEFLANPPRGLVRGKGTLWLAGEHTRAFGYSCAGAVHRVFAGASWWAGCPDGAWPKCGTQRRRLLEKWHRHFGDRRQEIALIGLDLDPAHLSCILDACLLSEEEALEMLSEVASERYVGNGSTSGLELH